jgi:hypothetical protein
LKADNGFNARDVWSYKELEEMNCAAIVEVIPVSVAVV